MTVPGAVQVIAQLMKQNSALIVGAGSVFDVETAERCLVPELASSQRQGLTLKFVNFTAKRGTVLFPGAWEVIAAWKFSRGGFRENLPVRSGGRSELYTGFESTFPADSADCQHRWRQSGHIVVTFARERRQ